MCNIFGAVFVSYAILLFVLYKISDQCFDPKIFWGKEFFVCPVTSFEFDVLMVESMEYFEHMVKLGMERFSSEPRVFFDVGANIGLVSFVASEMSQNITIHAFVSNEDNYRIMSENNKRNNISDRIIVYAQSLYNTTKEMDEEETISHEELLDDTINPEPSELEKVENGTFYYTFNYVSAKISKYFASVNSAIDYIFSPPIIRYAVKLIMGLDKSTPKTSEENEEPHQLGEEIDLEIFVETSHVKEKEMIFFEYWTTLSTFIKEQSISYVDTMIINSEGNEWGILKGIDEEDWDKFGSIVMKIGHRAGGVKKDEVKFDPIDYAKNIAEYLAEKGYNTQIVADEVNMKVGKDKSAVFPCLLYATTKEIDYDIFVVEEDPLESEETENSEVIETSTSTEEDQEF